MGKCEVKISCGFPCDRERFNEKRSKTDKEESSSFLILEQIEVHCMDEVHAMN